MKFELKNVWPNIKIMFKKMWKPIVFSIFNWAYEKVFDYIDENKDGVLSDEEIRNFFEKMKKIVDSLGKTQPKKVTRRTIKKK